MQKKISQRELARRAGVTNATVSLIESNRMNPSVGALKRVLDGIPIGLSNFFALEPVEEKKLFWRADKLMEIGKGPISYRQIGGSLIGRKLQILKERALANPIRGRSADMGLLAVSRNSNTRSRKAKRQEAPDKEAPTSSPSSFSSDWPLHGNPRGVDCSGRSVSRDR